MDRPYKIPESVLVVIHTPALEVLLLERADRPGAWQSVTGSLDHPDEPLRRTCIREVAEETGIAIGGPDVPDHCLRDWGIRTDYAIWATWRHRYAPGITHNREHAFGLTVPPGIPVRLAPREHLAWRWLPWAQAAEACFSPSNRAAILRLPAIAADAGTAGRPSGGEPLP